MEIFTPTRLGPMQVRNRIATSAHTTNFADESGVPTDRLVNYQRARARGGVGLIMSEGVRVHPKTKKQWKLAAFAEGAADGFGRVADAIRAEGGRFVVQLVEPGRHFAGDQTAPWSASDVPWAWGGPIPHRLTPAEIADIVAHFAAAATTLRRGGVDGIEINLAHGHLLQQFLSPVSNRRDDAYGGSLDNRLRFGRETVQAVRAAAGERMAVGVRISASEFVEGGLTPDDQLEAVGRLLDAVPLDFLHVSHSAYMGSGTASLATQAADMSWSPAPFRDFPRVFKQAFPEVPIVGVCRIDTLELAEELVAGGYCDIAAMTRAHIADPDIVRKHHAGQSDLIRRCVACNQGCIGNIERDRPITCVVNPTVGFEGRDDAYATLAAATGAPAGARTSSRWLVVGAGPAGMEAALTARMRGHDVTVMDAAAETGGQLRLASALIGRERWSRLIADQAGVADRLGVTVRLGATASVEQIIGEAYDAAVVATGSSPRRRNVEGYGAALTVEAALRDGLEPTDGTVVLVDEDGGWPAAGLALHLAGQGHPVHLVSQRDQLAWNITVYSKLGLIERLADAGVSVHLLRGVVGMSGATLELADAVSGRATTIEEVAHVVWAAPRRADDRLALELGAAGFGGPVHVVGDAYAPRSALEAVREGRRLDAPVEAAPTIEAARA